MKLDYICRRCAVLTAVVFTCLLLPLVSPAHDVITTKITWNREISRIVLDRCVSCHRPGGSAFSLSTYQDARPWAKAIQEEVLERRMPPWGAVKGFGEFRDDPALTPEQMEVIADWVEGGAPEGEDKDLPKNPKPAKREAVPALRNPLVINGETQLNQSFTLGGLLPKTVPPKASFQITAELPDGTVYPLIWLMPYQPAYGHVFRLKEPLRLPRGTVIHGVPAGVSIALFPAPALKNETTRNKLP
jgi:hypothetical protein